MRQNFTRFCTIDTHIIRNNFVKYKWRHLTEPEVIFSNMCNSIKYLENLLIHFIKIKKKIKNIELSEISPFSFLQIHDVYSCQILAGGMVRRVLAFGIHTESQQRKEMSVENFSFLHDIWSSTNVPSFKSSSLKISNLKNSYRLRYDIRSFSRKIHENLNHVLILYTIERRIIRVQYMYTAYHVHMSRSILVIHFICQ